MLTASPGILTGGVLNEVDCMLLPLFGEHCSPPIGSTKSEWVFFKLKKKHISSSDLFKDLYCH